MIKNIQIVAFDNPNPPDYGGAIEVYHKLKALKDLGVQINLHFFEYGRRTDFEGLENICFKVFKYKRVRSFNKTLSATPFIVKTRENILLLENLTKNPSPILFEGIHCCSFLDHPKLKDHFKIVRTHNIEHQYYAGLYNSSKNLVKKVYYKSEAQKLEKFEPILKNADLIFSLSKKDTEYFKKYSKAIWIPPFSESYTILQETKPYILFHANLQVEENIDALLKLTHHVFSRLNLKVIVAGKDPSIAILNETKKYPNITLLPNPSKKEMNDLILNARCHVFYTDQNTGVKLRLVHAIHSAGHIIMNSKMLFDNYYKNDLEIVDEWNTMVRRIEFCFNKRDVRDRTELRNLFDNQINLKHLLKEIECKIY